MSPEKKSKGMARYSDPSDISLQVEKAREQIESLRKQQEELQREKSQLEELRIKYTELIKGKKELMESLGNGVAVLEAEEEGAERMHELAAETRRQFKELLADISSIREDILDDENVSEQIGRGLLLINRARRALSKARGKIEVLSGGAEAEALSPGEETATERGGGGAAFTDAVKLGFGLAIPFLILAIIVLLLARVLL